jgi:hypothetical protein
MNRLDQPAGGGLVMTIRRTWWRAYGVTRRVRPASSPGGFTERRWREIGAIYRKQDVAISAFRQEGRATDAMLAELTSTLRSEADVFRLASWYYQQHRDQLAAFACQRWANHVRDVSAQQYLMELFPDGPPARERGDHNV